MPKIIPQPFQLVADHPVLDFINTLDNRFVPAGPLERLTSYADLRRFGEQAALLDPTQVKKLSRTRNSAAAAGALKEAHALRESLAAAFYNQLSGSSRRPPTRCLKVLQRYRLAAAEHQELAWEAVTTPDGSAMLGAAWHWGRNSANLMLPVWILAQSGVSLLTSARLELVHQCRSETCRWLFLDSSKNHSRRWCDMKVCGNRMKAKRFRAERPR